MGESRIIILILLIMEGLDETYCEQQQRASHTPPGNSPGLAWPRPLSSEGSVKLPRHALSFLAGWDEASASGWQRFAGFGEPCHSPVFDFQLIYRSPTLLPWPLFQRGCWLALVTWDDDDRRPGQPCAWCGSPRAARWRGCIATSVPRDAGCLAFFEGALRWLAALHSRSLASLSLYDTLGFQLQAASTL